MPHRSEILQSFVGTAAAAFDQFARAPEARRAILQIFAALEATGAERPGPGSRLPVCSHHLERALEIDTSYQILRRLVERFVSIEPLLEWRRRASHSSASENFADGHANAMIIGPGGLEERQDVWLGATLMAPQVRYPDHNHAPEEVYLVLSEGEFRQGEGSWFSPGLGGTLYNPLGIKHAMRSLATPLFAFWALRAGRD